LPLAYRIWILLSWPWGTTLHARAELLEQVVTSVFLGLVVLLFVVRRGSIQGQRASLGPGLVALAGTFLLSVAGYLPVATTTSTTSLLASSLVVIVGTLLATWSAATLGRCFGIFPEVRGLVVRGPYRFVRHPVYVGEAISAIGLVLVKPSALILLMFGLFVALQYGRTIYEERALRGVYPDYMDYARRVPRLLPGWRWMARHGWLVAALVAAMVIGEMPAEMAACCAPAGATGFGTAWFVDDFAQYESAMRQGAAQPGWLVYDSFTAEPHQPAFMFPLYVGIGKLAAALNVPAMALEHAVEILARVLLVLALWRFCRAFARGRAAAFWALGLALFASGFELLAQLVNGPLSHFGATIYVGAWSYELNSLGLLLAAPHVPLAMAATLELARDGLRPHRGISPRWLLKMAALGAAVALLQPFHLPVLLGAMLTTGLVFWQSGRGHSTIAGALAASVAALPALWSTVETFNFQTFWVATYASQNLLPSPAPHELVVDLGVTLILASLGVVLLRGRVAPFGLLVWLCFELIAMYLPVPYQRRLSFGIQPALAVLAANCLVALSLRLSRRRMAVLRWGVLALAASSTVLVLAGVVSSGFKDAPLRVYRSTPDLDAAAAWLDTQAAPTDVILADWEAANYLAPRTPARVFGGQSVATLDPARKQFAIATVFAHGSSLSVARLLGVQWVVYGPSEASLNGPANPDFQSGPVRVYRVPEVRPTSRFQHESPSAELL
jgi:protein-S-isoprenylcysteine O-methyltransferase Ste14